MSSLIVAGLALATGAATVRAVTRNLPRATAAAQAAAKRAAPQTPPPAAGDGEAASGSAGAAGDAAGAAAGAGAAAKAQANWFKQSMDDIFGSGHYKGGFEVKMSRAEAAKILGVSTTSSKDSVKKAHKRLMLINHPDRGGSAYMALKVNEAKAILDQKSTGGQ
ncbi:mitochondrial import inner membrane translocase subunit TIM14-like [Sycon ciliatum]|uniref:mitochondrial import inner membrane translocase subunit TIM14-like n=1 Tax=Sycon ciliatum TaxID=27933 RepID=UPI0031F68138